MKKMKCWRIENYILEEMKKILKDKKITETAFVEIALIEKLQRMKGDK